MSDKEQESNDIQDDELTKEERIEAARKKFEEMKKKKKKGKKKKKEDESDKITPEPASETTADAKVKDSAEAPSDKEPKNGSADAPLVKEPEEDSEKVPEQEAEKETTVLTDTIRNADNKQEALNQSAVTSTATDSSADVAALNSTIDQQKATISKLRDEITDLKLERMDLKDKISELEKKFAGGEQSAQPEVPKYVPAKPVITSNKFASSSKEDVNAVATDDFRERLLAWKGWQVDLTPMVGGHHIAL